ARELGYTEPNPAEDLNGLDVARKALVIAREAGLELELENIQVEAAVPDDLAQMTEADEFISALEKYDAEFQKIVTAAEAEGKVLRYIAEIDNQNIQVGIQAVAQDHPLYTVQAGENAMVIHSSFYNPVPIVIRGYGAGADVTAAGLFGDLIKTMSVETSL
ncbi:MAG: bifunctional aspartate kinase/homoserine dehydrogenase I, partial [Gammaproteobacteria bacterium]|nr:bifunctional aspartate kinase/homoserine dehydrogenase I [Gammaproteobacteria bacterium]